MVAFALGGGPLSSVAARCPRSRTRSRGSTRWPRRSHSHRPGARARGGGVDRARSGALPRSAIAVFIVSGDARRTSAEDSTALRQRQHARLRDRRPLDSRARHGRVLAAALARRAPRGAGRSTRSGANDDPVRVFVMPATLGGRPLRDRRGALAARTDAASSTRWSSPSRRAARLPGSATQEAARAAEPRPGPRDDERAARDRRDEPPRAASRRQSRATSWVASRPCSTICSRVSTPPSSSSGASWPTRRTSCARRCRSCAARRTSRSRGRRLAELSRGAHESRAEGRRLSADRRRPLPPRARRCGTAAARAGGALSRRARGGVRRRRRARSAVRAASMLRPRRGSTTCLSWRRGAAAPAAGEPARQRDQVRSGRRRGARAMATRAGTATRCSSPTRGPAFRLRRASDSSIASIAEPGAAAGGSRSRARGSASPSRAGSPRRTAAGSSSRRRGQSGSTFALTLPTGA